MHNIQYTVYCMYLVCIKLYTVQCTVYKLYCTVGSIVFIY